jgi:hypothetical protein
MKARPMNHFHPDPKWALGYLQGRSRAFARGSVPVAALIAAIRLAERHGASSDQIASALQEAGSAIADSWRHG